MENTIKTNEPTWTETCNELWTVAKRYLRSGKDLFPQKSGETDAEYKIRLGHTTYNPCKVNWESIVKGDDPRGAEITLSNRINHVLLCAYAKTGYDAAEEQNLSDIRNKFFHLIPFTHKSNAESAEEAIARIDSVEGDINAATLQALGTLLNLILVNNCRQARLSYRDLCLKNSKEAERKEVKEMISQLERFEKALGL